MAAPVRNVKTMTRLLTMRSSSASRASGLDAATPKKLGAGVSTPSLLAPPGARHASFKMPSGAIMQRPERDRPFDVCMSSITIFAGIGVGAWIAKETAAKLEDLDVFVPDDDDDDD